MPKRRKTRQSRTASSFVADAKKLLDQYNIAMDSTILIDMLMEVAGVPRSQLFSPYKKRFATSRGGHTEIELPTLSVGQLKKFFSHFGIIAERVLINSPVVIPRNGDKQATLNPPVTLAEVEANCIANNCDVDQFLIKERREKNYYDVAISEMYGMTASEHKRLLKEMYHNNHDQLSIPIPDDWLRKNLLQPLRAKLKAGKAAQFNYILSYQLQSHSKADRAAWQTFRAALDKLHGTLKQDNIFNRRLPISYSMSRKLKTKVADLLRESDYVSEYFHGYRTKDELTILTMMRDLQQTINDDSKCLAHADISKVVNTFNQFATQRKLNTLLTCRTFIKKINDIVQPYNMTTSTDVFEETLLKMAGVATKPTNCTFGQNTNNETRIYFKLAGITEQDAIRFTDYLRTNACDDACISLRGAGVYIIEADAQDLHQVIVPAFAARIKYWSQHQPEKLAAYIEQPKPATAPSQNHSAASSQGIFAPQPLSAAEGAVVDSVPALC